MEKLQAQNEALKKQCNSLQQEVKQWKYEYEILDACIELEQGKMSELKAENERLKELKCKFKEYCTCNTEKYIKCLQEIKVIADTRFVNGLNEEADIYNAQMDRILDLITKVEEE